VEHDHPNNLPGAISNVDIIEGKLFVLTEPGVAQ
jgi:hypothetical protein